MIWVVRLIVVLVAVIGIVAIVGWLLPVSHEASRSADVARPPADVYALISDLPNYSTWWSGNSAKVEVVEQVPPSRLVTRIIGETAFGGTWTIEVTPIANGSRITVTERGEIYNPIFRALSRFVFGYTGTMDSFLAAAARRLN